MSQIDESSPGQQPSIIGENQYVSGVWYESPHGTPCTLRLRAEQDTLAIDGRRISFVTIRGFVSDGDPPGTAAGNRHLGEIGMRREAAAELHAFLTAYLAETTD